VYITQSTGAKWLDGESVDGILSQMMQQQRGEECFANAGIGAGDEDNLFCVHTRRRRILATDGTRMEHEFSLSREEGEGAAAKSTNEHKN
jgi:ribosomal protein L27